MAGTLTNYSVPSTFHGVPKFINYQFSFFTVPVLLAFVPILYIPATMVVAFRIFKKFLAEYFDRNVNVQLFGVITLSHYMSFLFFIAEFFYLRLPLAGAFTSWCASVQPNGYLIIFIIIVFYINYATMIFPCLVALLRLNLIVFPSSYQKINTKIIKCLPIVFIYPILCIAIMFPGNGFCSHVAYPIYGSIMLRVTDTMFGWTNNYILMFNTFLWVSICLGINAVLIVKLIKFKLSVPSTMRSQLSQKGEISLTLTTTSMALAYLTNGLHTIFGRIYVDLTLFLVALRPFMNDVDTCVVPWVFYLTHPIFQKKSVNQVMASAVERMGS
ncbi:Serpentine Receptor, class U [Caenorhabditis elegans]|uniref:Serpentine Receptor, class U n=1 Tax=Caenorhabditis elegans TaxID=6239 RepID=O45474_CAEEL|nr:Serpentine Receptor, class U [Caenorhabditis elegans]CAB04335.1 Serpentine Receptor, class U [Caenorhabditis elegans]|eukprot:NP_507005.1 Serpentine Receptor, class U [Caenorhabditis elegans]